jgi:signal transduction histidine kinase
MADLDGVRGSRELLRALDRRESRRGLALLVGALTVLAAADVWVILGRTASIPVTMFWLVSPLTAILTTAFVLRWVFENDHDPSYFLHVSKWAVAGSVLLGLTGLSVTYVDYAHGIARVFTLLQAFGWACGGFVIGSVIGVYSAGRRGRERQLDRERRKAESLAETLSVLNRVLRHDIRNDVNVIEGYVDLIAADSDVDQERVDVVRSHTSRVVQLADYARKTERLASEGESGVRTVDVVEPIARTCRKVHASYPNANVATDLPERAEVRAHELVDSAFENLVENAVEHHPGPEPTVRASVERKGDEVIVTIADDGAGIPESEVAVLESGTESKLEHSNGMGLWLANWIVTYSGGGVEFAENEPTGSEITVRLPTGVDPSD